MRAFLALLTILLASGAGAQTSLTLLVRDADTAMPIVGARLEVGGLVGAADNLGAAELVGMDPGPLRVVASTVGYVPVDTTVVVARDVPTVVVLSLRSEALDLGDVVVEAVSVNDAVLHRRGFFERRATRTGAFVTREELDLRGAHLFSDAFHTMAGVRVQREGGTTSLISTRRRGCAMAIYLDGVEMAYIAQNLDALPFDDVAAIEVYRGPSEVPLEYSRTRAQEACGIVLVWTRIVASND